MLSRSQFRRVLLLFGVAVLSLFVLSLSNTWMLTARKVRTWTLWTKTNQQLKSFDINCQKAPLELDKTTSCTTLYCQCKTTAANYNHCVDLLQSKFVFLNAMSSNHYDEAYNMFGTIQDKMPEAKILVYDIGLTKPQVDAIKKMCNVELRVFNFDKYPAHVSADNLVKFAWKPLLINEVCQEHEFVVWVDTSIRFKTSIKEYVIPYLLKDNFTYIGNPGGANANVAQYTHDGTISYLNLTRKELTGLPQVQLGFGAYWVTPPVRKMLDEWVDCAMHESCIAPKGSTRMCRHLASGGLENTTFTGCHRFDQSASNMILYKHQGKHLHEKMRPVFESTCTVGRSDRTHAYEIRQC